MHIPKLGLLACPSIVAQKVVDQRFWRDYWCFKRPAQAQGESNNEAKEVSNEDIRQV